MAIEYRGLLISAIHGCAVRFPDVASNVIHLLMDFLNGEGAVTVIELVREIVEVCAPCTTRAGARSVVTMVLCAATHPVLRPHACARKIVCRRIPSCARP
ncbi:hypothetical protein EON62_05515 [archaeon]|nr:MAG: hypothetical protein EON62_05515 [archaeon]